MKTTIYSLIAIFIIGIVATGFSHRSDNSLRILIQSSDNNISAAALNKSAEIITARLKSFSDEKFTITTLPEKNQIQLIFPGQCDLKTTENLLTQKGKLEFYEIYNHDSISKLLNDDGKLLSLFHENASHDSSAEIGCISNTEISKVNACLNSVEQIQNCKFSWSKQFEDTTICLYALRMKNGNGALLKGSDIESFKSEYEKTLGRESIKFNFSPSATAKWAEVTKRNLNRAIAIVLDDNVIYAPVVRSAITSGNCQISGDFTPAQVRFLVAIIGNGELPANFYVVK
jgi:preprotein translocase subunit SecD